MSSTCRPADGGANRPARRYSIRGSKMKPPPERCRATPALRGLNVRSRPSRRGCPTRLTQRAGHLGEERRVLRVSRLELPKAAGVEYQRVSVSGFHVTDECDDQMMVSPIVARLNFAVDPCDGAAEARGTCRPPRPTNPGELVAPRSAELGRQVLLIRREHVRAEPPGRRDPRPGRRGPADGDRDEWWVEREAEERLARHTRGCSIRGGRQNQDSARETAEDRSKLISGQRIEGTSLASARIGRPGGNRQLPPVRASSAGITFVPSSSIVRRIDSWDRWPNCT